MPAIFVLENLCNARRRESEARTLNIEQGSQNKEVGSVSDRRSMRVLVPCSEIVLAQYSSRATPSARKLAGTEARPPKIRFV